MKKEWHELADELRMAMAQFPDCRPGQAYCVQHLKVNGLLHPDERLIWEEKDRTAVLFTLFHSENNR
jgi:hypothetical protein